MPLQFLVGGSVSVINIMIHALITLVAVGIARRAGLRHTSRPRLHLMTLMVVTALVLMIAHTAEIIIWSLAYAAVDAAPAGSDLLDFAFVNYTTLGYGDFTAAGSLGRALAVLEALAGQVFLATLVARLVSAYAGGRRGPPPGD